MLAHLSVRFPVRHRRDDAFCHAADTENIICAFPTNSKHKTGEKHEWHFIYSGLPCRTESCAATVSDTGRSRLPWGRDMGSAHGVVHHTIQKEKLRSHSSWIALSRPKALSWVRFAVDT